MKSPIMLALALLCAALGSGCASRPENIHAAYASETKYSGWTLNQMLHEQANLERALAEAAQRQHRTRANDTAGIWVLGLPIASMTGRGIEAEIARLKGELAAIHQASELAGYNILEADIARLTKRKE